MFRKNTVQTLRNTVIVLFSIGMLAGCLESEESVETAAETAPSPGNSAPVIGGTPPVAGQIGDSYTFTPSLESDYGCLSIYTNLLGSGGTITGVEIYGIAFTCTFAGATLTSVSNLNTTDYVITTPEFGFLVEPLTTATTEGHLYYPQDYWEIVSLVVDVPPVGCGFSFQVDTFFSTATGLLFDWAQSTMGVTLALGTSVSTSSTITVNTTGFTEWRLSFEVSF